MSIPAARSPIRVTQQTMTHTHRVKHPMSLKSGFPIFSRGFLKTALIWIYVCVYGGGAYSFYLSYGHIIPASNF